MKNSKKIIKKPIAVTIVILVILIFVIGKKIQYYAAGPKGEKDCPPIYPQLTNNLNTETTIEYLDPNLPWVQTGGTINDASCLSKTSIYGIIQVTSLKDIQNAITFAKANNLQISPAGVKHSMGGHAFYKNALILDMKKFNQITMNEKEKTITVQSGATWHDIQNVLHPKFAVKAMQSTDIFTVGGSISVNAHGMDHQAGAVAKTIQSMRVLLPDGSLQTISKTNNSELFNLVIGGYGLFGIIIDVMLEITENVVYESGREIIDYREFPTVFKENILPDKDIGLFYAHLSTAPQSFLKEMILYTYRDAKIENAVIPPLEEVSNIKLRRLIFNLSKEGTIPMRLKWFTEKYIEPLIENCTVSRNQAMSEGEACFVSRNEPMHDSVKYLQNNLKNDTDILHEYFIPRAEFIAYIDGMREILQRNDTNLLNASVRMVHKEDNFLNYSPNKTFSIVLYINQRTDEEGNVKMKRVTQELIDLTTEHGGRFFLPYQLHYNAKQLKKSYPEIETFFEAKKKYDPQSVLTNTFYEKYSKEL